MTAAARRFLVAIGLCVVVCAAAATVAAPAGAAGPTRYALIVYHEPGGAPAGEYTAYLLGATHTWSVEGRCDGGSYTKVGRELTLQDECQSETIYLLKAKGRPGVWEGFGSYAFFELIKQ